MVLFETGEVVNLDNGGELIHVQYLGGGNYGQVHSFVSLKPECTAGHVLVAGKINHHVADMNIAMMEIENLTRVQTAAENQEVKNATTDLIGVVNTKQRVLVLMEHLQPVTLESVYMERLLTSAEVFTCAEKIFTLVGNLHQLGFCHLDLKPPNILVDFKSQADKNNFTLLLLEKALRSQSLACESRVKLVEVESNMRNAGAVSMKPTNKDLSQSKLRLGDLGLATSTNSVPRKTPGTMQYTAPEGLLGGRSGQCIDIYASCLTIGEIAIRAPLLIDKGTTIKSKTSHILAQVVRLRGTFSQKFLDTTLEKTTYFSTIGVLKNNTPPKRVKPLRTLLDRVLTQDHEWQPEDTQALYKLLLKGLANDPAKRADLQTLILQIP